MSDVDTQKDNPQNASVTRTGDTNNTNDIDAYLSGKSVATNALNTVDVVTDALNTVPTSRPIVTIGDINAQIRPAPSDVNKVTLPGLTVENRNDKPGDRITVDVNSPEARNYLAYQKAVVAIKGVESGTTGSGFFVDDKGLVITKSHVAKKGDTILVTNSEGKTFTANVAMVYEQSDLAALQLVLPKDVKTQAISLPTRPVPIERGAPIAALGHPNFSREVHISPGVFLKLEPLSDEQVNGGLLPKENPNRIVFQTLMDTRPASSGSLVISLATGEAIGIQSMSNSGGRTIVTPIADVNALVSAVKASRGEGVNINFITMPALTDQRPSAPLPAPDGTIRFDIRSKISLDSNAGPFFIDKPK